MIPGRSFTTSRPDVVRRVLATPIPLGYDWAPRRYLVALPGGSTRILWDAWAPRLYVERDPWALLARVVRFLAEVGGAVGLPPARTATLHDAIGRALDARKGAR